MDVVVADIRDRHRLLGVFRQQRPDMVFHAAAHKHVPLMQENAEEAVSNNVVGTKNVVDACLATGVAHFVLISTDKAVAPRSVMGASKRMAEMVVCDAAARCGVPYSVVRFGNVLGSRGSVVPFFQRQIERGGPLTVTHPEMKRFFMTIPEAVHLVLQAASLARGGELFVLDMGEPIRIVDLAKDLVKLGARRGEDIEIVFTGLRPGEKLEETLWEPDARVDRTAHPKIWRVFELQACSGDELAGVLERLRAAADMGDHLAIDAEFARAIPTYLPMSTPVA
jgi:FlaA1/EpsC-like NDP-sugar epimerase